MIKRVLFLSFCHMLWVPASPAALIETTETDLTQQLQIVDLKISAVEENLRDKVKSFHRLEMGHTQALFFWEEAGVEQQSVAELKQYLRVSIRTQSKDLELLQQQRADLRNEKEWQNLQEREKLLGLQAKEKISDNFQCAQFPALPLDSQLQLSQDFGKKLDPETGIQWNSLGWWLTRMQSEVKSCAPGTVVFSGAVAGRGQVLILDHGQGFMTLYANLHEETRYAFKKGDAIKAGRVLGLAKEKFYFEVRRKGLAINPRLVFSAPKLALIMNP